MFGYLTPQKGELKVREYEVYRAHYCGVCFSLRKRCTLISCASLTYDAAFLSLLGANMASNDRVECSRCPFKPYKRIHVTKGEWADYAADVNVLLARKKCEDDKKDDHPLRGALGALALRKAYRRAANRLSSILPAIEAGMEKLSSLEGEGCDSIDEPALAFGDVMEAVFTGIPAAQSAREPLAWMGKNIGRWVYLLDAWDDLDQDEKRGNYNVLLRRFGSAAAAKLEKERVEFNLLHSLYEASTALPFLPEGPLTPIVENTLVEGAAERSRKLLAKYTCAQCSTDEERGTMTVKEAVCPSADIQEET
ncbi:MAG: DUF5685 family protein [Christensenellales bacterium]